jgi:hypothetical protein
MCAKVIGEDEKDVGPDRRGLFGGINRFSRREEQHGQASKANLY